MRNNSAAKNKSNLIIGLVLCFVCVAFLVITIIAICESFSEKARLESIGATVTLKITWLFVADILAIIASGIFGVIFLSKKSPSLDRNSEDEKTEYYEDNEKTEYNEDYEKTEYNEDYEKIPYNTDESPSDDRDSAEEVASTDIATEATTKPSRLKINMGKSFSSERASDPMSDEYGETGSRGSKSSELSSGFFSAGDDL